MKATGRTPCALLSIVWLALPAAAQDQPAQPVQPAQPQSALQELRARDAIAEAERAQIAQWVDERIAQVLGTDPAAAGTALNDLRSGGSGSAAFTKAYGEVVRQTVGRAYKGAEVVPAARLLTALTTLDDVEAYAVFVEALSDDRPPVRAAAAIGLRRLRAKLGVAGGKYVSDPLAALRDAGTREASAPTLRHIYEAMNFAELPNPPAPQENVEAVLTLLAARAEQYTQDRVRAYGADVLGLRVAGSMVRSMNDAQRRQLAAIAAKMLRFAARVYTSAPKGAEGVQLPATTPREETELLIVECEKRLVELINPPVDKRPNITGAMQSADQIAMKVQFNNWAPLIKEACGEDVRKLSAEDEPTTQPGGGG